MDMSFVRSWWLIAMFQSLALLRFSSGIAVSKMERFPWKLSSTKMQQLQNRVNELNIPNESLGHYFPFVHKGNIIGYMTQAIATQLQRFPDFIQFNKDDKSLQFTQEVKNQSSEQLTETMAIVSSHLRENGFIKGWRNELLPVVGEFGDEPYFLLERSACPIFGVKAYGVHVNGFVRCTQSGEITHMWVGKRSKDKSTYPGMLDHIVAGGQPHGISLFNNVIKECEEEASIPREMANRCKSVGAVSYTSTDDDGNLKRDVLFCYDLELDSKFVPVPLDGEVECFMMKDIEWVIDRLVEGGERGYKPNCNLVIIDFLIRQGVISPESPRYLQLLQSLRTNECK